MAELFKLPSRSVDDWHLCLRVSLYPDKAKLYAYTYAFAARKRTPSEQLFNPKPVERPESSWEAIENLELGIDLLKLRHRP